MSAFYPNSNHVETPEQGDATPKPPQPVGEPAPRFFKNSDMIVEGEQPAEQASTVKVDVPPEIAELRKGNFFDAHGMYREVFARNTTQDRWPGADAEVVEAVDREVSSIFSDHGLTPPEAQQVVDLFNVQPTEELQTQWAEESEAYLDSLGEHSAALAADAVKLLDRDPRVAKLLGPYVNHPAVVKLAIEKARSEKLRGRL
ncbi:MAG TPA: hypothetical protein VF329_05105 [Gammaproteobacteria bacterium]